MGPVIDWHVVGVDEDGDPWNAGNPLPVSISGTVVGTVSSTTVAGEIIRGGVTLTVLQVTVNMSGSLGPSTIVSAVAGKRIQVIGFWIWPNTTVSLEWRSNTTVISQPLDMNGRIQYGGNFLPGFFVQTSVGEALLWRQAATVAANIRGVVHYVTV